MRLFEWLLLVSFIHALVLPLIPKTWRRRWLIIAVLLPLAASVAQIAIEGWRIQIVPLYALALLIILVRLRELGGAVPHIRQRRGIVNSAILALLILGNGIGAGYLLPIAALPAPTGIYPVGVVDREVVDTARDRRLMVSVWYPAAQAGTPAPLIASPDVVTSALAESFGFPAIALHHLRYFTSAASQDAPLLGGDMRFPVLVFSHGLVGIRAQSAPLMQELASHGYVVVAIDHTDAAAVTVFLDGEVRQFDLTRFESDPSQGDEDEAFITERVLPVWVADQQFVYDTVERWQEDDPLFGGRLDVSLIASLGHSFGGATSLEVCRIDSRCRAAVNLDGGLYGDSITEPVLRPLMLMTSADSAQYDYAVEEWTGMIDNAANTAYWLELVNSDHLSFTFTPLLTPILVPSGFNPYDGLAAINRYVLAFFYTHLRNEGAAPLTPIENDSTVRWITTTVR
jgi:predicted dienelactone hydrolase